MKDDFPKYQYSVFAKNGHDGQFVVRTNDQEEFEKLVKYVDGLVDARTPAVVPSTAPQIDLSIAGVDGTGGTCPIHGTPLVWKAGTSKTTGKAYGFWACPTKNADNSFCKGANKR